MIALQSSLTPVVCSPGMVGLQRRSETMDYRRLNRREFCHTGMSAAAMAIARPGRAVGPQEQKPVVTVMGTIGADDLGVTLPHEHVLVDFVGADQASPE